MPRALVLRHMYSNNLYTIETVFRERGITFEYVEGFSVDLNTIDPLAADIWVVLGGSMGVYEADIYPYLNDEIRLIGQRMTADKPILGICLGAQLMSTALGCPSYKGPLGKELGFLPLTLTDDGNDSPVRHFDPAITPVLQMHGDTFDLPGGTVLLASSALYPHQAFRAGKNGFGIQFHPEFNRLGFDNMLVEDNGKIDVVTLREGGKRYLCGMEKQMNLFMRDLLDIWDIPRP